MRPYNRLNHPKTVFFTSVWIICALSLLSSAQAWSKEIKIALVLDKGGRDDKSFNAAAYEGSQRAKSELSKSGNSISVKVVEAMDENAYESLQRSMAKRDFDLIIAVGVSQAEATRKVSQSEQNQKFAIVDASVSSPNVRSLLFEEHEGSFLVGVLAGLASSHAKVGFIGGMDIPLIRRFELGYKAGVQAVKPKAQVISNFIGITSEAWNNPTKAKELALSQYAAGADVIFAAAGASNSGLFDAAEEKNKFAIGVDSNQNWIKPGRVLTSMLKRVDQAVFDAIRDVSEGKFTGGEVRFGLKNKGVDYALDQYNAKLITPEMKNTVEAFKEKIIKGQIKVPDYYKKKH